MPYFTAAKLMASLATPKTYTESHAAFINKLADHYAPNRGYVVVAGDPIQRLGSVTSLLVKLLARMDDLLFRPIVHLSPLLIGFGIGLWANLGVKAILVTGAIAYVLPKDWYISKLAIGVLSGSAAALLLHVPSGWWKAGILLADPTVVLTTLMSGPAAVTRAAAKLDFGALIRTAQRVAW